MLNALARKPVCAAMELDHACPPFPPPWSVEKQAACFVVKARGAFLFIAARVLL
jgi:hypothetical protein